MSNSPTLFKGTRASLLVPNGFIQNDGRKIQYDGQINYIKNSSFELNATTGWNYFADAAAALPTDGIGNIGGTAYVSIGLANAAYLRGSNCMWLQKNNGGFSGQGQGISHDFTIDAADQGRPLTISFEYEFVGGSTYQLGIPGTQDSDLTVYIYDVTNGVLIEPSSKYLNGFSSTVASLYQATFQTTYNSTSYRLILYKGTTTTNIFGVYLDNFRIYPNDFVYSSSFTNEQSYLPTVQGLGTLAANNVNWSQMGDKLYLRGRVTIGTPTAVEARIYLPNASMIVDDVKITAIQIVGDLTRNTAMSAGNGGDLYLLAEPGVNYLTVGFLNPASGGLTKQNGSAIFSTSEIVSFNAIVPIKGWSTSLQVSTDAGTRPCFAMYRLATAALTANQPINYATLVSDSHGAVTTGASWKFTAPFADVYQVTAQGATGTSNTIYSVYKNGTLFSEIGYTVGASATNHIANGSVLVPMNAGDYVDVRSINTITSTATTVSGSSLGSANYVFIRNVRAQQVIAASESVSCSVWLNANAAVAANGTIIFNSAEYDSHGAFNLSTGTFTAPQAAEYLVNAQLFQTVAGNAQIVVYKNGTALKGLAYCSVNTSNGAGTVRLKLIAGDTITVRSSTAQTYAGGSLSGQICTLQINKIGNY